MNRSFINGQLKAPSSTASFFYSPAIKSFHQSTPKNYNYLYKKQKDNKSYFNPQKINNSVEIKQYEALIVNNDCSEYKHKNRQSPFLKKQILLHQSPNNSMSSNSIINQEQTNKNTKIENDNNNSNSNNNSNICDKIQSIIKELNDLKEKKIKIRKSLENNLARSESLEQIYLNIMNDCNENNFSISKDIDDIIFTLDNIKFSDKENLKEQISSMLSDFNIEGNSELIDNMIDVQYSQIEDETQNSIMLPEEIVNKFLSSIANEIYTIINQKVFNQSESKKTIQLILKYLININCINKAIKEEMNFLNKEYKTQKNKRQLVIAELTAIDMKNEEKKQKKSNREKMLKESGELFNHIYPISNNRKSSTPKNINRKFPLDSQDDAIIFKRNKNLNSNLKENLNTSIKEENIFSKSIDNPKKTNLESFSNFSLFRKGHFRNFANKRSSLNTEYSTGKSSFNNISSGNLHSHNSLSKNSIFIGKESFCYFKPIYTNDEQYDPLVNFFSPEKSGYIKGFISVDHKTGVLIIEHKKTNVFNKVEGNERNKKGNFEFVIDLRKICKIVVQGAMREVIKIHNVLRKFEEKDNNSNYEFYKKIFNINKLLFVGELRDVQMEQNEKIKAALSQLFSFSLEFDNCTKRVECLFVDFEEFRFWLEGLGMIVNRYQAKKVERRFEKNLMKNKGC